MDVSAIHARRLSAKEVLIPKNGEQFHIVMGTGNSHVGMKRSRKSESTSTRDLPEHGGAQRVSSMRHGGVLSIRPTING